MQGDFGGGGDGAKTNRSRDADRTARLAALMVIGPDPPELQGGNMSKGYPKEIVKSLIEGKLPWETLKGIMSSPKDEDRLRKVIEIEQERVPWEEKILLPLAEHLYIVRKGPDRIVKCLCGHEFGNCRRNWKLGALVYERAPQDGEANYREAYSIFTCSGILFNHESPLRKSRFVTQKIVKAACRIAQGSGEKLVLGNISIERDWGPAEATSRAGVEST